MRKPIHVTARLRAEIRRAQQYWAAQYKAGRRAKTASYNEATGRVTIGLSNGDTYEFQVQRIPSLASATPEQLRQVEVTPSGIGLHWECIDADLSVPGLLLSSLGRKHMVTELARAAGQVRSAAKAMAARRNGAKGGRPKDGRSRKRG